MWLPNNFVLLTWTSNLNSEVQNLTRDCVLCCHQCYVMMRTNRHREKRIKQNGWNLLITKPKDATLWTCWNVSYLFLKLMTSAWIIDGNVKHNHQVSGLRLTINIHFKMTWKWNSPLYYVFVIHVSHIVDIQNHLQNQRKPPHIMVY